MVGSYTIYSGTFGGRIKYRWEIRFYHRAPDQPKTSAEQEMTVTPAIIDSNTAISLATVIILLGASWRLSWLLSRIDSRTDGLPEKVSKLEASNNALSKEVALLKQHVEGMESDVNNLWSAFREDAVGVARRDRPPRGIHKE
jgi:hypothetical protein